MLKMPVILSADLSQTNSPPLDHFWSRVVGAGRANEGLRANWQQHLKHVSKSCGFKYVRFHGLYHDDMHVYHCNAVTGEERYNFQYVDELFDSLLNLGVRPFVEFGFCPSQLASKITSLFWWKANISPPEDLAKWGRLVAATVAHWVSRYGIDEVRSWYFECWNEPNLGEFWAGTRSQYYALYAETAKAVRSIDTSLRIGGPATSNYVPDGRFDGEVEDFEAHKLLNKTKDIDALSWKPVWVSHFLDWCHTNKVPVDFVSVHPYPTDWALDSSGDEVRRTRKVDATPEDLALIRTVVADSPFPDAEIHLTEWSSSPSSRDHSHDYMPAATYIIRTLLASRDLVDSLAYWTFTDVFEEEGAGPGPFHGGFGMINFQGIVKPTFHAFRFLNQLGNCILTDHVDHGIITRCKSSGSISAILFHFPAEMTQTPPISYHVRDAAEAALLVGKPVRKTLQVRGLKPGQIFKVEKLTPGNGGDVISAWKSAGSPANLSLKLTMELSEFASRLDSFSISADQIGTLSYEAEMMPWTVLCITSNQDEV